MNKSRIKLFSVLALLIMGIIAVSGIANADSVPVTVEKVWINDREFDFTSSEIRGDIIRDDEIDVEVKLSATGDDENVAVEATVEGLDHDSDGASDKTHVFTVEENRTYYKKLNIKLPDRMDNDEYALRIEISNRQDTEVVVDTIIIDVGTPRNAVKIKDIVFSPENQVVAGRALLTTVRLKNIGEKDEEDVKVTVKIPELGLSASDYIDDLEAEDSVTSEELYMRIPTCAEEGTYNVDVVVEYDEGDETVSEAATIDVVANEDCEVEPSTTSTGKTIITIGSETQDVAAGESGVIYPLTLTNTGSASKTYVVSATAGTWADVKVSPNVVVLGSGETKIVYVYVTASEDAQEGEQTFGVSVSSGDQVLKEVTLKANVVKSAAGSKLKRGLEVGLVVLIVLLVILGLIIGFNRLKGDEDEEPEESQTYY